MDFRVIKGVVVDAGHGGSDPGAVANGIKEKDYNLLISNYMVKRFKELGIPVEFTRETDVTLSPKERINKIKSKFGNGSDVIVISNHINAGGGEGAEIIYALRNNDNFSKNIAKELEIKNQDVRKYYQRRLPSNPALDYYFIHRDTPNKETILVEYGFIDNENDVNKIKNNWQDLAEAVVKATANYIGVPYDLEEFDVTYYIVKKGESLWSIAKKFNISVEELKKLNNLKSNLLSIGQKLITKEEQLDSENNYYIVEKGDSLYKIANKFNTTVDSLKKINNLNSNLLSIGQKLLIKTPVTNANADYYIVKKGDTLYGIAKKFNLSIEKIKELNNLKSNVLSVGQKLLLKKDYDVYSVKKGDTLYSIAKNNNTNINYIIELNNLINDNLFIGQKLLIP